MRHTTVPRSDSRPLAPVCLSVIVPAWNEAGRIQECLAQLEGCLAHLHPEIIVVDDGSTDGTPREAAAWMARHPGCDAQVVSIPHRGKGRAVYAGVHRSHGDHVAYIDADLDIPAQEIDRLLRWHEAARADVVVGSKRLLTWRELPRPLLRRAASISFSWLVGWLFHLPVRDTQTGVKLFPGPWLRRVAGHARVPGFLFDVELLAAAADDGLRIAELPVSVAMRRPASRIGIPDGLRCLLELAQVAASVRHIRRALHTLPSMPPPDRRIRWPGRRAVAGHGAPGG